MKRIQQAFLFSLKKHFIFMRVLVILLLYSLLLFSCNYDKYKNTIQESKGTFWDVSKRNSTIFDPPENSFFFAVNGACSRYALKRSANRTFQRIAEPVNGNLSGKWEIQNNRLDLLGSSYLVLSHTSELLTLIPLDKFNDTLELIQSHLK